jgi:hypothetical protein
MSRISLLLVAAAVAAGVVGCAQCDTCDDFPAPCTGPNCGQNQPGILDYMPQGAASMGAPPANAAPAGESAGPAPTMPETPPVNPASSAPAMDPAPGSN